MQRLMVRGGTDRFERKRDAILDAATLLLNTAGVKGLTLADAGAAVGLSTTSVTYYFRRKDDLAAACMLRGILDMEEMAEAALLEAAPEARLRRLLDLYLGRVQRAVLGEAPPLPVLADLRALNAPALQVVFAAFMRMFRRVRQIFEAPELEALSRGRRTARTHLLLEQLFWAPAWLPSRDAADYAGVRDHMLDILVNGVAAEGERWAPAILPMSQIDPWSGEDRHHETFLMAATRLINARGYRGASVDKISAALKVTKGSFYHHNDAKDDLVVACFNRTYEVMRRAHGLGDALPADAWTRLSSVAAALAEFQLSEHGPLLRTSALSAVPEPIRRAMIDQSHRVSDRLAAMIAKGSAEGSLRQVDPMIAAQMLVATINAGAELGFWVPGVKQKAAPAVFARPLLMGLFSP